MDETLFTYEETGSRRAVASSLRALADQLAGTGPLALEAGGERVTVPPSEPLEYEVELERTVEDGAATLELEVELEWREETPADPAGETDAADETATAAGDEAAAGGSEAATGDEAAPAGGEAAPLDLGESETPAETPAVVRRQATFEVFRDRADEWRWRLVHRNGNVVATSGEGYTTRRNAEKGLRSVVRNAPGADVVDDL